MCSANVRSHIHIARNFLTSLLFHPILNNGIFCIGREQVSSPDRKEKSVCGVRNANSKNSSHGILSGRSSPSRNRNALSVPVAQRHSTTSRHGGITRRSWCSASLSGSRRRACMEAWFHSHSSSYGEWGSLLTLSERASSAPPTFGGWFTARRSRRSVPKRGGVEKSFVERQRCPLSQRTRHNNPRPRTSYTLPGAFAHPWDSLDSLYGFMQSYDKHENEGYFVEVNRWRVRN